MLGDQKLRPIYHKCRFILADKLYFALASVDMADATVCNNESLKVAAIAIACGNIVASPALANP